MVPSVLQQVAVRCSWMLLEAACGIKWYGFIELLKSWRRVDMLTQVSKVVFGERDLKWAKIIFL